MKFRNIEVYSNARYVVDVSWDDLLRTLDRYTEQSQVDLNPDFQRGHVWTETQQIAYVEYIMRNGQSGRSVYFNCAGWMGTFDGQMVLVDGKQRITAVIKFLSDEIKVFGLYCSEFEDQLPWDYSFKFHINDLPTRKQVLQWYIDLNSGIAHTSEEIEKVEKMIEELNG